MSYNKRRMNMNESIQNIEHLLPLYFEGRLNTDQQNRVEKWMHESEENRKIFLDMADIYSTMDKLTISHCVDTETAWRKVRSRMRRQQMRSAWRVMERTAAILLMPVLMVSLLQYYNYSTYDTSHIVTYTTNPGMTGHVTLPDGTEVTLNSNTSIAFPARFSSEGRRVMLQGEAYFDVIKDADCPFEVNTPLQASVKVYGTRFNVEAYPGNRQTAVTLEEGSVALKYMQASQQWREKIIIPGEQITYNASDGKVAVRKVEVDVATSWKDGKLIFRNTPVKEVLRSLSKRYNVSFKVRNPKVYQHSYTGTLDMQHLERIFEILSISSDMHFKYMSNPDTSNRMQMVEVY